MEKTTMLLNYYFGKKGKCAQNNVQDVSPV